VGIRARCAATLLAAAALLAAVPAAGAVALLPPSVVANTEVTPNAAARDLRREVRIGIGDQKPDMFYDPRFAALGVRHARLAVGWDAMRTAWQVEQLDGWLNAARARGVKPLISIGHSRTARRSLPTTDGLRRAFRRIRQRYPWVTTFTTWNEANHCGEPTCNRPRLVAAYYRALRRECPKCTILAPELLDQPNTITWVRAFRKALGFTPRLWGLHNYVEANRFRMRRLRALLRVLPRAEVWLTETGGLVRRDNKSTTDIPEGAGHAGEVTRYLFDHVLPRNPQIKAVYLYHWNAGATDATWDSGLITSGGRERRALFVLRRVLGSGLRPNAAFRVAPR